MNQTTPDDFGDLVRSERLRRGLRFGELARLLLDPHATQKQISRAAQRLVDVERSGRRDRRLVAQLVRVLHLDPAVVSHVLAEENAREQERFRECLSEPVDPILHIRALPGVWITKRLTGADAGEAFEIAASFAREKRLTVCLAVDRTLSVWFDRGGREYARVRTTSNDEPKAHTFVGGRRIVFETRK